MVRRLATALLTLTLPVLTLVGTASPAHADSFDYHLTASVSGASGGAWVDFEQGRYGGNFTPNVTDTKCDSHQVYIEFYTDGGKWQNFTNKQGCNHSQEWGWYPFTYKKSQPATTVKYVYVKVCVSDWGPDTCKSSAKLYNPYH